MRKIQKSLRMPRLSFSFSLFLSLVFLNQIFFIFTIPFLSSPLYIGAESIATFLCLEKNILALIQLPSQWIVDVLEFCVTLGSALDADYEVLWWQNKMELKRAMNLTEHSRA